MDQLESFFPGLANKPINFLTGGIKNIIKANLTSKRNSRPMSVIAMRRNILEKLTPTTLGKDSMISNDSARISNASTISHMSTTAEVSAPTGLSEMVSHDALSATELNENFVNKVSNSLENSILRWEIGKLIGQGGFGKVYHALNLDTGVMVLVIFILDGG